MGSVRRVPTASPSCVWRADADHRGGLCSFEWQYDVIAERNAVRSVFSGRSTSYQVFVMRLLEEGLYRFVILCPIGSAWRLSTEPVWASSFIAPIPAWPPGL